jgi:hypothetical protein
VPDALRFVISSLLLAASMLGAIGILLRVDPFQLPFLAEDVRFPRAYSGTSIRALPECLDSHHRLVDGGPAKGAARNVTL